MLAEKDIHLTLNIGNDASPFDHFHDELRMGGMYLADPMSQSKIQDLSYLDQRVVQRVNDSLKYAEELLIAMSLKEAAKLIERIQVAQTEIEMVYFTTHTTVAKTAKHLARKIAMSSREMFKDIKLKLP